MGGLYLVWLLLVCGAPLRYETPSAQTKSLQRHIRRRLPRLLPRLLMDMLSRRFYYPRRLRFLHLMTRVRRRPGEGGGSKRCCRYGCASVIEPIVWPDECRLLSFLLSPVVPVSSRPITRLQPLGYFRLTTMWLLLILQSQINLEEFSAPIAPTLLLLIRVPLSI